MGQNHVEERLIAGCRAGKRSAQRKLYDRFSIKMLGVCMRYCADRDEAQDMMQEAFIKVFSKIDDFQGKGSFEGWVRRIMVTTCLNMLRKKAKLHPMSSLDGFEENIPDDLPLEEPTQVTQTELMGLIQQLPAGYKMVFNLFVFESYSHKQIADELSISENTSKSQLSRARLFLQKEVRNLIDEKSLV